MNGCYWFFNEAQLKEFLDYLIRQCSDEPTFFTDCCREFFRTAVGGIFGLLKWVLTDCYRGY